MQGFSTWAANLNPGEESRLSGLKNLPCGKAASARHDANADHVSEAGKHGRRYYLAHDKRMLGRKNEIARIFGSGFEIVTLRECIDICKKHDPIQLASGSSLSRIIVVATNKQFAAAMSVSKGLCSILGFCEWPPGAVLNNRCLCLPIMDGRQIADQRTNDLEIGH